jgi:integrase
MAVSPTRVSSREELLDVYANHLSSKGSSRKQLLGYASGYLEYAEGLYNRESVEKYIDHIRTSKNYAPNSIALIFKVIRTVFDRNELDWPFNRGEAPMVREDDVNAPALDPDIIREMIGAVKDSDNEAAQALLAISTTYGLRQEEIINLTQDDFSFRNRTIYVNTLKHGRQRTHLLPDNIIPYVRPYDFDISRSRFFMINLWYTMENMISFKHVEGVGWHAVRRTLDTLLLRDFPVTDVRSFLRWKQSTSNDMAYRYSKTKFVGREGVSVEMSADSLSGDQVIFAKDENGNSKHPFIEEWLRL